MRAVRWRDVAAWLVAAALLWPIAASFPKIEWNLHVWGRLRQAHRGSPDTGLDEAFAKLRAVLPPGDVVGFHFAGPRDNGRLFYRLRYALSPVRLRPASDTEFVIESGPATDVGSLAHDPHYTQIHEEDDLRVFRRVSQ